ncbi:MAG TPA: alpha/beta hydrolase [Planctomycetota bacterium]
MLRSSLALFAGGVLFLSASVSAQETAPHALDQVYVAGETANWTIEQGGASLGFCASRYLGQVELAGLTAHVFDGRVELVSETPDGPLRQRFACQLWTDPQGHPLRCDFRIAVTDVFASVETTFTGTKVQALVTQGAHPRAMDLTAQAGAFLLANNFLSHLELALALHAPLPGQTLELPMFSVNALATIPIMVTRATGDAGESEAGGARYTDSLGEILHFDAGHKLVRVEIPGGAIEIVRSEAPIEWFSIEPPAQRLRPPMEREDVSIAYGDVVLAGEITRPIGAKGRLPGVFFISGSGMQDRDGFSSGIEIGTREILDRLTAAGYAVLRVDDRGAGASKGPVEGLTYQALIDDARHCVRVLAAHSWVDPARMILVGHSEGAETAPILAPEFPELAAIVLMAGPGRSVLDLIHEQLLYGRAVEGGSPEESSRP